MHPERFRVLTGRYPTLRMAVVGDFCLDRYLEIDPAKKERSLETGLPVRNVVNIRPQPGAAGTILNNLVALGVGRIVPVGFCGDDGEGFELRRALGALPGVTLQWFCTTAERKTFTYTKPLICRAGKPPQELNRLDLKNWTPTPRPLQERLVAALRQVAPDVEAIILLEQVDLPETGVVTRRLLREIRALSRARAGCPILADSRRGLRGFPPVIFKMNRTELGVLAAARRPLRLAQVREVALQLARHNRQPVFVTLAELGLLGASPTGQVEHVPSLPRRGPIDIVGAGDAVTANLASALAAGATLREALELANAAASVVIHKLGTTGTASVPELQGLLCAG